jgi:predicted transcriptional regulator
LQNAKVIDQLKVLDNEVKFRILSLLTESGAKSITDISKILHLNFSTTHKYLEQLESVGLVRSKQENENRLKRMFYIMDFYINLTPRNVSSILRGGKSDMEDNAYGNFNIITNNGNVERFNKFKFAKIYLDAGIPKSTIENTFDRIKNQIFDGITLIKIHTLFNEVLNDSIVILSNGLRKINHTYTNEKIILNILNDYNDIIDIHNKYIFIKNLGIPKLLNYIHDIRGISIHGIDGKVPKNLKELLDFILILSNNMNELTYEQSFGYFNYFVAPFSTTLSEVELNDLLANFFSKLNNDIQYYINLDIEPPYIIKDIPITYFKENNITYEQYKDTAIKIANVLSNLKLPKNIHLIEKEYDDNICYNIVGHTKVTSQWGGWFSTVRSGEAQNIIVDVSKLPHEKDKSIEILDKLIECHKRTSEFIIGNFFNKSDFKLKSVIKKNWNCLRISDLIYSFSLLNEESNPELTTFILEYLANVRKNSNIRIKVKSCSEKSIYDYLKYNGN